MTATTASCADSLSRRRPASSCAVSCGIFVSNSEFPNLGRGVGRSQMSVHFEVAFAGTGTDQVLAQALTRGAYPADLSRRIAQDEGVGRYIPGHHRARADHRKFADRVAADDRAVGAQRRAALDQGERKLVLALDMGP